MRSGCVERAAAKNWQVLFSRSEPVACNFSVCMICLTPAHRTPPCCQYPCCQQDCVETVESGNLPPGCAPYLATEHVTWVSMMRFPLSPTMGFLYAILRPARGQRNLHAADTVVTSLSCDVSLSPDGTPIAVCGALHLYPLRWFFTIQRPLSTRQRGRNTLVTPSLNFAYLVHALILSDA